MFVLACLPKGRGICLPSSKTRRAMSYSAPSSARGISILPFRISLHLRKLRKVLCWQPQVVQSFPSLPIQEQPCTVRLAQIPCRSSQLRKNSLFPFSPLMELFCLKKDNGRSTGYFVPLLSIKVWAVLQRKRIYKKEEYCSGKRSGNRLLRPGQRP